MRKLPLLWINHSKFISLIRHNICICFPYGNLWLNPELFTFRVCGGLLFAHGGGLYSQSHWKPRHDCSVHKVFDFVRLHWLNFSAFYLITENQYVHGQLFFIIFCNIYCHYAHMTYAIWNVMSRQTVVRSKERGRFFIFLSVTRDGEMWQDHVLQ